jgi:hypothetical protein
MSFPWVVGEMVEETCVKQPNEGFGNKSEIIHVYLKWSFVLLLKEHFDLHESLVYKFDVVLATLNGPTIIRSMKLRRHDSNDVGTGLYAVLCKKFRTSLLQDHSNRMVVPRPFQRQFINNYFIFKPNYFITTFFPINFHNNYLPPFLITTSIL